MATRAAIQRAARRAGGSDITRLVNSYTNQVQGLTSQYESEFSKYQQMVDQTMAPFLESMRQYQTEAMPAYEAQLAQFQTKYDDYMAQLREIEANPVTERTERVVVGKTWYGKKKYGDVTFFDPKPIPTFDETAPTAPGAPEAPEIGAFDSSGFEERRGRLQQDFQREMSERRGARLQSRRRTARTMLSGAQS